MFIINKKYILLLIKNKTKKYKILNLYKKSSIFRKIFTLLLKSLNSRWNYIKNLEETRAYLFKFQIEATGSFKTLDMFKILHIFESSFIGEVCVKSDEFITEIILFFSHKRSLFLRDIPWLKISLFLLIFLWWFLSDVFMLHVNT